MLYLSGCASFGGIDDVSNASDGSGCNHVDGGNCSWGGGGVDKQTIVGIVYLNKCLDLCPFLSYNDGLFCWRWKIRRLSAGRYIYGSGGSWLC